MTQLSLGLGPNYTARNDRWNSNDVRFVLEAHSHSSAANDFQLIKSTHYPKVVDLTVLFMKGWPLHLYGNLFGFFFRSFKAETLQRASDNSY